MLRRDRQLRTQVHQLKDAALFAVALWFAHFVRHHTPEQFLGWTFPPIEPFGEFVWIYLFIIPGVPLILESQGFYQRPLFASRRETAWILLKSCLLVSLGVILMIWMRRLVLARSVIVLFGFFSFTLVVLIEELLRMAYRSRFGQVELKKRVLLVGAKEDTAQMVEQLKTRRHDAIEVLGELDINTTSIQDLVTMLHETSANSVIINAKHAVFGQIERVIHACEIEGVEAWLMADFFKTQVSQTTFDDLYGRPVLVFRSAPEASWEGVCKRLLDFTAALIMLMVLALPLLLVALAIRITSPGPILFKQRRCGLNGRPFTMLKFRSMVTNAEQRKHELAALNEMAGPVFKVTNDPRITPIGRWLRKFSVDEFPQLLNVLRGEMSLVGPRPLPVDEVQRFDDPAHRRRLSVKPGLTCLWQVSGRNQVKDFKEWVRLDLEYIDNWSFWLDLKILWRTIPVVLTGAGAK
jgi:exopolysaccharide biosynthesis polyprenyl glycosylphosphotransferase